MISDHPAWEPVPLPADADAIGEVVWMARVLVGVVIACNQAPKKPLNHTECNLYGETYCHER